MAKKSGLRISSVMIGAIAGLLLLLGWGAWKAYSGQSLEDWIRQSDLPVARELDAAARFFTAGQFGEATVHFALAYDLAAAADSEGVVLWQEHLDNRGTPRQLGGGDQPERMQGGLTYFKNRMAESSLGLASSIFQIVLKKYQRELERSDNETGPRFTPPATELDPAFKAIEQGLQALPQSEDLRLLKAQILTRSGSYADAQNVLNELLLINTNSAQAYNQLGIIFSSPPFMNADNREMYRERALAMFEKAALLRDNDGKFLAEPHYSLGMYYATPDAEKPEGALPAKEDAITALRHLRRYLELAPASAPQIPQVQQTIKRLTPLE